MAGGDTGLPWSKFPAGVVAVGLIAAALISGGLTSRNWAEFGSFLALALASLAGGALVGFLVGGPGLGTGDGAAAEANTRGWADRLGVFSNWLTGAAFILVITNGDVIAAWFADLTSTIAETAEPATHPDTLYRYSLGAWMVAAASLGFATGFMQMVTTGRTLIRAAQGADVARQRAEEAATQATAAAETAISAAALFQESDGPVRVIPQVRPEEPSAQP